MDDIIAPDSFGNKEENLKNIFNSANYPFLYIDAKNHTIKMANNACNFFGNPDKCRTCHSLIRNCNEPCNIQGKVCPLIEIKKSKKPMIYEHVYFDKNNNEISYDVYGFPIFDDMGEVDGVIKYFIETTERKNREKQILKHSEITERYKNIIDSLPFPTFAIDEHGKVIAWNGHMKNLTGIDEKALIGRSDYEYSFAIHGRKCPILIDLVLDPDSKMENLYTTVEKDHDFMIAEMIKRGSRNDEYFLVKAGPIYNSDGKIIGAVESIVNITDLKRKEEYLGNLAELKDNFIRIASHDLKNEVSKFKGFAHLLNHYCAEGAPLPKKAFDLLPVVVSTSEKMHRMIQDYLDFQILEDGAMVLHRELTDINKLCMECAKRNEESAGYKNIEIIMKLQEPIPKIFVDPARIEQVMDNLVNNAIKYNQLNSDIIIETKIEAGYVMFLVSDCGPGLSRSDLKRVFERYTKLNATPTGNEGSTGLGLSICKYLIEMHDGKIGVYNNLNFQGATFWFKIKIN